MQDSSPVRGLPAGDLLRATVALPSDDPGLVLYLREVARLPPLSIEEEDRLVQALLGDSPEARDALILRSLRLVTSLVTCYLDEGMCLLNLIEHGNLGLLRAVEACRYADGPFCTFAAGHICLAVELHLGSRLQASDMDRSSRLPAGDTSGLPGPGSACASPGPEGGRPPQGEC
jgi:hypothetical protein